MAVFTTALGLYGGVLWSGELQGFIIHEMVPAGMLAQLVLLVGGGGGRHCCCYDCDYRA
jgi:hypothetical protein